MNIAQLAVNLYAVKLLVCVYPLIKFEKLKIKRMLQHTITYIRRAAQDRHQYVEGKPIFQLIK